MTTKTLLGLALGWSMTAWAADFHPLDVKTGEWEATMTVASSGVPPIPAEALARMTPEQRARLEERTKSLSGRTTVNKTCVTKDKLDKPILWGHNDKSCTYNLVTSTSNAQEIQVECSTQKMKSSGKIQIEAMNSENVKGSVQMKMTSGDRSMDINSSFTAKWLGATCSAKEN